jgi:hypothetical protein
MVAVVQAQAAAPAAAAASGRVTQDDLAVSQAQSAALKAEAAALNSESVNDVLQIAQATRALSGVHGTDMAKLDELLNALKASARNGQYSKEQLARINSVLQKLTAERAQALSLRSDQMAGLAITRDRQLKDDDLRALLNKERRLEINGAQLRVEKDRIQNQRKVEFMKELKLKERTNLGFETHASLRAQELVDVKKLKAAIAARRKNGNAIDKKRLEQERKALLKKLRQIDRDLANSN